MSFRGVFPPVITPFRSDCSIDRDGFVTMLEHLIASKVHGIIIGGTTGEYYAQTPEERVELFRLAKSVVNGRLPLIAGVGALRTEDAVAFAMEAKKLKYDGLLVSSPYYAVPTQKELWVHALAIDHAADLPIMLYNYPGRTGTMMDTEFLARVGRSTNFVAIKESSGSIHHLHTLARDFPHIDLFCGMDDQALEFFAWGARGWVCGAGNCLPQEHLALYDACVLEQDFDKGRRIMSALLPLMTVIEQGGKAIQAIKYGCEISGLPAGMVRRPLSGLEEEQKRELDLTFRTLKAVIAAIQTEPKQKAQDNVLAANTR